jgi:hypothetical protein
VALVYQYNKRAIAERRLVEAMNEYLNPNGVPTAEASRSPRRCHGYAPRRGAHP